MLGALLRTATFLEPDDLPLTVQKAAARLGAVAASISLVDYEQLGLRRFSGSEGAPVVTKSAYGDTIDVSRRRQLMAVRAEAQRAHLPPLTLITPRLLGPACSFPPTK